MPRVPDIRVRRCNRAPLAADGDYVLYWMTAARRARWNHALDRAVDRARELAKPLLVLEALRVSYPWASDRLHRFVLDGMADNAEHLRDGPALYFPYVEAGEGDGSGLLQALAARACLVVTDDFPSFFVPRMLAAASAKLGALVEAVDANGLLPLRAAGRVYPTAYGFRGFVQRELAAHLGAAPRADALAGAPIPPMARLPRGIVRRWPRADARLLAGDATALARLPIDHGVGAVDVRGGSEAAAVAVDTFLGERLDRYGTLRNAPEEQVTSGLSPYLHFGHVSAHEVFARVAEHERWNPDRFATKATGKREGWWGMSAAAEGFLDQLVTWRELGFNMSWQRDDYDRYESLPEWALKTLAKHGRDEREHRYSHEDLDLARTHDPLWNAAQTQLVREGRIHNYLRMLWGKKVLEWSATPADAFASLVELNNRYALDGRDPSSYSGIAWCFGRYDRAWGPERPIYGTVRYMSSENTARKFRVRGYLERYGPDPPLL